MTSVVVTQAPSVFATYIRGGTSKAVFFHEKDIPAPGKARDEFLIRIMGSPDPTQVDGMGGARILTSKVAIVRPSRRDDADVDYTFAQIGLGEAKVSYDGNCGNISSGVGPFAVNEGLLKTDVRDEENRRIVRVFNTGRQALLIAHVPIDPATRRALEKGDFAISGCPGSAAPILMDYAQTAQPRAMLPTGNIIDRLECTFGTIEATYCEVGNPIVFVDAQKMGIAGNEVVTALDSNRALLDKIREVRGRLAQKIGNCNDWSKVDEQSPMLPMVALLSRPTSDQGDVQSRLFLDNHTHGAMAGTAAVCTGTTSRMQGSITNRLLSASTLQSDVLRIQHPSGFCPVYVTATSTDQSLPTFSRLGFIRTARYIFQGNLFIPADISGVFAGAESVVTSSVSPAYHEQCRDHLVAAEAPADKTPVTKLLAAFAYVLEFGQISAQAIERLRQCLLDHIGVAELGSRVGESSPVFYKAVHAMTAGFSGSTPVVGTTEQYPPQYAAMLNGAFAHTLDFDDTHTGGIIHVGTTIVATLLAEAANMPDLTYRDLLTAMAVGYEISIRIAIALGVSSWHRGFHNTSIAGIFGAVAVLAKLRRVDATTIENAFGLACSFASGSMQYLSNGAWNKRLHPAKAAHDSFVILALAQAGTIGAAQPIEGKFGLIAAHTDTPNARVDVDGLGSRWELVNIGLKPYPACRATHTCIELAAMIAETNLSKDVSSITITMDPAAYPMVADPSQNKVHPQDVVDAQFSDYFQTAACFLYGDKQGWSIYDRINDAGVQELCSKISIVQQKMNNDLETNMSITWQDGHVESMKLDKPKWEQPERQPSNKEVAAKFNSLVGNSLTKEQSGGIIDFVVGSLDSKVTELFALLEKSAL